MLKTSNYAQFIPSQFYYTYYTPHKPVQRPYIKTVKVTKVAKIHKRRPRNKCLASALHFVKTYFNESSIHGFAYLVRHGLTWFERIFWFILLTICVYFYVIIVLQSSNRFHTKSTVIGMERDFYFWNTTLPSLTVCPMERLSQTLFDEYCSQNNIVGQDKDEFHDFLESLANSTYMNFGKIREYDSIDETLDKLNIMPEDYMQLIYNLTYDSTLEPQDTLRIRCMDGRVNIHVRQVLTEYGLCYMANNYLGEEYTSKYLIFGNFPGPNKYEHQKPLLQVMQGTFFHKDVGFTFIGFSDAIDVYIHSAYEIMKVDQNFGYTDEGVEYDPESMEMITEPGFAKTVSISQRKCRLQHESNLTHFPIYTKNLCLQECRLKLAFEICKCIPHFYPNRIANPKPVCSYKILKSCFPKNKNYFLKLYKKHNENHKHEDKRERINKDVSCSCLPNCRDAVVSIRNSQVMKSAKQLLGSIGSSVSMKTWPQHRLKRQVIYSYTDYLVSIGGTAGLFLGFSVLGTVEFLYFFSLRLICYIRGYKI